MSKARQEADAWNDAHRLGTPVRYWPGLKEGLGVKARTRSPAYPQGDHACVKVTDYGGGIRLTHVEPEPRQLAIPGVS